MELHYLSIPYAGSYEEAARRLHVNEDLEDEFRDIFAECQQIGRPKGVFGECPVFQDEAGTHVGDQAFASQVMRVNFKGSARVFPYVITCGRELYDFAQATDDPLERYWIDTISELALREVGQRLHQAVLETYGVRHINSMNPGSLPDFPISCQRGLFSLLEGGAEKIGVELRSTFLMLPYKSGSGIYYESEAKYENCMLCTRLDCPGRRAPFNEKMYSETYGLHGAM